MFNENDPYPAQWLRNLYTDATVIERDIRELGAEVADFDRCHFFAGIGGWEHALTLAGWPAARPVWTGSCPCQPFSAAGRGLGEADPRHLWPEFRRLIALCRPAVVFGEQVASAAGREWLARVRADLEVLGYAVGAANLAAASVGAPHIRHRLYWVADAGCSGDECWSRSSRALGAAGSAEGEAPQRQRGGVDARDRGADGRLGIPDRTGWVEGEFPPATAGHRGAVVSAGNARGLFQPTSNGREQRRTESVGRGSLARRSDSGLADPSSSGWDRWTPLAGRESKLGDAATGAGQIRAVGVEHPDSERCEAGRGIATGTGPESFWADYDLVPCSDEKARRIEPGSFPLAHGVSNRVGRLRAYGNAIVPQVAAMFIRAFMESTAIGKGARG